MYGGKNTGKKVLKKYGKIIREKKYEKKGTGKKYGGNVRETITRKSTKKKYGKKVRQKKDGEKSMEKKSSSDVTSGHVTDVTSGHVTSGCPPLLLRK